jgi:hypothetical protein
VAAIHADAQGGKILNLENNFSNLTIIELNSSMIIYDLPTSTFYEGTYKIIMPL